jgi:hypothetical protein
MRRASKFSVHTHFTNMTITTINFNNQPIDQLVSFRTGDQGVYAHFQRPLNVSTPPFVTSFPTLSQEQMNSGQFPTKTPQIDINMKGAGEEQEKFKEWMDKLDDMLLQHIYQNQSHIGKMNLTKEQIGMMQKRGFRSRVSNRTGKSYPEAMTVRYKASAFGSEDVLVWDLEGNPCTRELQMNDIVALMIRYEGCYVKPGQYFGNSWSLMGVLLMASSEKAADDPPSSSDVCSMFKDSSNMTIPACV